MDEAQDAGEPLPDVGAPSDEPVAPTAHRPPDPPTPVDLLLPGAWRSPRPDLRSTRRPDDADRLSPVPPVVRGPSTLPLPLEDWFDGTTADGTPFWGQEVRAPVVQDPSPVLGPEPDGVVDLVPTQESPPEAVPVVDLTAVEDDATAPGPVRVVDLTALEAAPAAVASSARASGGTSTVDVLPWSGAAGPPDPPGAARGDDTDDTDDAPYRVAPLPPLPEWSVAAQPRRVRPRTAAGVVVGLLLVGGGSLAALLGALPGTPDPARSAPAAVQPAAATPTSSSRPAATSSRPTATRATTKAVVVRTSRTTRVSTRASTRASSRTPSRTPTRAGQVRIDGRAYVGRPEPQVRAELRALGLRVREIGVFGRGQPRGTVLRVFPSGWVPVGTRVRLLVAQ